MMKKLLIISSALIYNLVFAQNIGIGTATPETSALLHLDLGSSTTKGLLVTGSFNPLSTVPDLGPGSRMMFYPGKAAFRAGYAYNAEWNNVNVGPYSFATGYSTQAIGYASTAMGQQSTAAASYTNALGYYCNADGYASTAIGYFVYAGGGHSVAIGTQVDASQTGSFFFGDSDPYNKGLRSISTADQIAMRFNGGYYFITSNAGSDIGVRVNGGGNSWSTISDQRRKENFLPVDGEYILKSIASMPQFTWNYKTQDPKIFRHYGPMAQDFYKAFGKDDLGIIGCDSLINQHDFLGVNFIAIQALEKRTAELNDKLEKAMKLIAAQNKEIELLKMKRRKR
jgi:hypothetical protein